MFSVRSTSMSPRWHVKDFSQSAKSAGDRVHLNTHTPLTQWSQSGLTMPLSRHSVGTYQENKFAHNSSTNTHRQSSQLAKPLWTDPGLKSAISMRDLISTLKKKKKAPARNEWLNRHGMNGWTGTEWMVEPAWDEWLNILKKSWQARKKPPPCVHCMTLVMSPVFTSRDTAFSEEMVITFHFLHSHLSGWQT